jgi:hypothetical protein
LPRRSRRWALTNSLPTATGFAALPWWRNAEAVSFPVTVSVREDAASECDQLGGTAAATATVAASAVILSLLDI